MLKGVDTITIVWYIILKKGKKKEREVIVMTMRVTYTDVNKNIHVKTINQKQFRFLVASVVSIKGNIEKVEQIA